MKYFVLKIFSVLFLFAFSITACDNTGKKLTDKDYASFKKPLENVNKILVEKDRIRIEKYCERRKWNMKESGTGLFYDIYYKGNGDSAQKGQTATINYTVKLLDGTLCYTSDSTGSKTFKIGKGSVETGLEEGILLMQEGDKAHFIMPPYLAYGLIGDEYRIPPRAIIVYDVELIELKK